MTATATDLTVGHLSGLQTDLEEMNSGTVEAMTFSGNQCRRPRLTVLMADDDVDDCLLAQEAWEELRTDHLLRFVHDGQELLDYVYRQGRHQDPQASPSPALILLDLNMPKKSGREVLRALKTDPRWRTVPVIAFTT